MRILSIEKTPVHEWTYLSAAPRGGSELRHLPLLPATVDALPAELEALIVTSDLQGVATSAEHEGAAALVGEVLAEELAILADLGELPHANHVGILLAGDLYSDASGAVRGASGDVRSVWSAFAERFRWVAGVAGNHDTFGTPRERERLLQRPGLHLLDGEVRELDGLPVGGLSGIIGQAGKLWRREEEDYLAALREVLGGGPEVLVLHQGPDEPSTERRGSPAIRAELESREGLLVICGHSHWEEPLGVLPGGTQVLNVDGRAVLLRRGG
jgi:Icc-related predicted phosphoesterase